ncbi:GntR family transcriptional regulator [Kribbella sp. NPDC049227]|uniref:GntR family transcriptional regulator n=1 Tax=Kribbella sp. NPDC049227 TaxID=3364113 RepID=UPI00372324F9
MTSTMDESTTPIRAADNGHAADEAYRLIREQILTGRRDGGEWLREGELADAFGVSRTPIREALRRLTAEGLVRYERNRGVQVQVWSVRDLDEIFSLRSVLEPWGCRLAATSGRADLTMLAELADAMDRIAPDGLPTDVDRLTELNNRFHRAILEAADNTRLTAVISSIVQVPLVWRTFTRYSPEALRRSLAHHHELVAALTAADPDWAESVMRGHVRAAWNTLRTE